MSPPAHPLSASAHARLRVTTPAGRRAARARRPRLSGEWAWIRCQPIIWNMKLEAIIIRVPGLPQLRQGHDG